MVQATQINISEWPTFGIPDLVVQVEKAREEEKYLFMWDKTEQIDTFFKYKGFLCDFFFQHYKVEHGRITTDEAVEDLRQNFIKAGRQGQHLLVNLNDSAPDFINVYNNPAIFDTNLAFNRSEWIKPDIHKSVLKQGEDYSMNNMNSGLYFMMPETTMQIRSSAPNEEALREVLSKIPHIQDFKFVIFE